VELYFSHKYNITLDNKSLFWFLPAEIKFTKNIKINSSLQHITYKTIMKYKDFFNIDTNNLIIISTIRNPYDRIISDLFYFNKININSSKEEVYNVIKIYLREYNDNHACPQYLFITDDNKQLIPNIKILHTETLNIDMHNLGYEDFNIKENCNPHKICYENYLNNDSIKIINEFYHYDFELFNYDKKKYILNS
jgi:hypothetical protein